MGSFLDLNYSLRPTKNVERKLIVECLRGLHRRFDLAAYRYIGLGSMWFSDFILFHKAFGIREMVSIENKRDYVPRAEYNAPYSCVVVKPGDTTLVLPTLELARVPSIVWLDYDQDLSAAPVLDDLPILCESLPSASIVMVTLNAHPNQLSKRREGGELIPRRELLAEYLQLPESEIPQAATTPAEFAPFVTQALFDRLESLTLRNSGGLRRFYAIFSYWYRDNAPMITVAGMIADEVDAERLRQCDLANAVEFATGRAPLVISIPHLTQKEKLSLDKLLPCDIPPTAEALRDLGFPLDPQQIEGYHRFYRFYPIFAEMIS